MAANWVPVSGTQWPKANPLCSTFFSIRLAATNDNADFIFLFCHEILPEAEIF